jgi:AraC-like DNA-binding protein
MRGGGLVLSGCTPAIADYPAGARLPLRVIDDYEFVWMLRGRAVFVTTEWAAPLVPGSVVLIPPGFVHGIDWDPVRPSRHGYVHFGFMDVPVAEPVFAPMTSDNPIAGLCAYLLAVGPVEETVRFLVSVVLAEPVLEPVSGPLAAAVSFLRSVWAELPLRRVTVVELAAAATVTRGYLTRVFQAEFGVSVAAALERVRCARAETLLLRTDLTVEAVARQCGFADVSHFSHRFRALYDVAPSAYRGVPSALDHAGVRRLARLIQ